MAPADTSKKSVLFVCLGNICRSPMAEGIFLDLIKKKNVADQWVVDSAAIIDYHVGKSPDVRTISTLSKHGITEYSHSVRQVTPDDFHHFDYIFGMDNDNLSDLEEMSKSSGGKAIVDFLGRYDPKGCLVVPDPYYSRHTQMFEQAAHAATACIWTFREDSEVAEYMNDISRLRKVTLKVPNEAELRSFEKHLQDSNVDYYLWTEDNMAVCIALKPQFRSFIEHHVKHLKLY